MERTFTLGQVVKFNGTAAIYMGKARDGSYALIQNAQGETKRTEWSLIEVK